MTVVTKPLQRLLALLGLLLAFALIGEGIQQLIMNGTDVWSIARIIVGGGVAVIFSTVAVQLEGSVRRACANQGAGIRIVFAAFVNLPVLPNLIAIIIRDYGFTKNHYVFECVGRVHRSYILVPAGLILSYLSSIGCDDLLLRVIYAVIIGTVIVRVAVNIPIWPSLAGVFIAGTIGVIVFLCNQAGWLSGETLNILARFIGGYAKEFPRAGVLWIAGITLVVHIVLTIFPVWWKQTWWDEFGNVHQKCRWQHSTAETGLICRVEGIELDWLSAVLPWENGGGLQFSSSVGPPPMPLDYVLLHDRIVHCVRELPNFTGGNAKTPVQVHVTVASAPGSTASVTSA